VSSQTSVPVTTSPVTTQQRNGRPYRDEVARAGHCRSAIRPPVPSPARGPASSPVRAYGGAAGRSNAPSGSGTTAPSGRLGDDDQALTEGTLYPLDFPSSSTRKPILDGDDLADLRGADATAAQP
jgi:hypothetical protein